MKLLLVTGGDNLLLSTGSADVLLLGPAATTYTLVADKGSYSTSGFAVTLTSQRKVSVAKGSYNVTGNSATLIHTTASAYTLVADKGSYTVSGYSASLTKVSNYSLTADKGSYSISGLAAGLSKANFLQPAKGLYNLSGYSAGLNKTNAYVIIAEPGSYVIGGNPASLLYSNAPVVLTTKPFPQVKYEGLVASVGFVGQVDQLERVHVLALSGLSDHLSTRELWLRMFEADLVLSGKAYDELAYLWLGNAGHTQNSINERWLSYWRSLI